MRLLQEERRGTCVHIAQRVYQNTTIYKAGAEPFKQSQREDLGHVFIRIPEKIHGHAQLT